MAIEDDALFETFEFEVLVNGTSIGRATVDKRYTLVEEARTQGLVPENAEIEFQLVRKLA